jgi:phenylalanyl-tRNA synthetase beta chain
MKLTYGALRGFLKTEATVAEIAEKLTALGLEVEHVVDHAETLAPFIVAEIRDAAPHPDAQKLRVCRVFDGERELQIVCGAPNARAGIKVALAKEGVTIPQNGLKIQKTSIRGVESHGMLCSAFELGLGEDGGGIIELPPEARPGEGMASWLGADDPRIEINVTPNRPDCLALRPYPQAVLPEPVFSSPLTVKLETEACPHFVGFYIRNVKNGESSPEMQGWLRRLGLRPISALVDITNYMSIAYARPLHVYDARKLQGNVTVRETQGGETPGRETQGGEDAFEGLNGITYPLEPGMLVIADERGIIGLAGVMGGERTAVDENTTDVFLEAALFDPVMVAKTGRALDIHSDARARFERGVDPSFTLEGAKIAVSMILERCGGQASGAVIKGCPPPARPAIALRAAKVKALGGLDVPQTKLEEIFDKLGFRREGGSVLPPSWRPDIQEEADLVEEAMRVIGYDAIPLTPLPPAERAAPSIRERRAAFWRETLAARGMTEICSYPFITGRQAQVFFEKEPEIEIVNPIGAEAFLCASLLPRLLQAAERNKERSLADIALFEIGHVFEDKTPEGQKRHLAGLRCGQAAPRGPFGPQRSVDAFDAKADLFAVLTLAGLQPDKLACDREKLPVWYHPARSGRISLGGKVTLGYFGEIHPRLLASLHPDGIFALDASVAMFECFADSLPVSKAKSAGRPPLKLSNYPAVTRDFAFIADVALEGAAILRVIELSEKTLIRQVRIFDIYQGKGVEEGKKSVALEVTLQSMEKTLDEPSIEQASAAILQAAAKIGLILRA